MRLQVDIISDLHQDYWPQNPYQGAPTAPILLVAGDIADKLDITIAELRRFATLYRHVLFVDGNHEHKEFMPCLVGAKDALRAALATMPNVHFLPDAPVVIDGVAFVGVNGWWDYQAGEASGLSKSRAMDYERLAGKSHQRYPEAVLAAASGDAADLAMWVRQLEKRSDVHSIIIATHTQPAPELFQPLFPKAEWRAYYCNHAMQPILTSAAKIKAWVYGHNHHGGVAKQGDILMISNPRGRPTDFNRRDYRAVTLAVTAAAAHLNGAPTMPPAAEWGRKLRQPQINP